MSGKSKQNTQDEGCFTERFFKKGRARDKNSALDKGKMLMCKESKISYSLKYYIGRKAEYLESFKRHDADMSRFIRKGRAQG